MLRLLRKCNSFSQQQKSDRLGTFPPRGQFCDVKYKKSVLICLELIYLRLRKCNSSDPYTKTYVIIMNHFYTNWYTAHLVQ